MKAFPALSLIHWFEIFTKGVNLNVHITVSFKRLNMPYITRFDKLFREIRISMGFDKGLSGYRDLVTTHGELIRTIVHFKRLSSRHIHKEINIPYCVFGINEIICKTCLKHIQTLTHKCNITKEEHFEAI